MLTPFEYHHELTTPDQNGKSEHVAGWGIWSDQTNDAILYDGFSSEEQAQAAVEVLTGAPYFNPDDDLSALAYLHWPNSRINLKYGGKDLPDFKDVFGHPWQCLPCPESCEMRVSVWNQGGEPNDLIPENCDLCGLSGGQGGLDLVHRVLPHQSTPTAKPTNRSYWSCADEGLCETRTLVIGILKKLGASMVRGCDLCGCVTPDLNQRDDLSIQSDGKNRAGWLCDSCNAE